MQNLFMPPQSVTLPFIGMADQANAGTSLTNQEESIFPDDDDYIHLMEMVRQRVQDAEIVDAQSDLVRAIGSVLEDIAREREEIKQQFLYKIEALRRERHSLEKACYDAAVSKIMMANGTGGSQASVPAAAQPNIMQPQGETRSSVCTHCDDPFKSIYTYNPVSEKPSEYDSTFLPPIAVPSSRDYVADYREAINHTIKNNVIEPKLDSVQPTYTRVEGHITPGIRLVPKPASRPSLPMSETGSYPTISSACSQESDWDWLYATWPSPPPLRYISQPVPGTPSIITDTIKSLHHNHEDQYLPIQGTSAHGYAPTQGVYGAPSLYCDEFGHLSSALTHSAFPDLL